jgi:D-alanyl-D-alanine carboxypeptidase
VSDLKTRLSRILNSMPEDPSVAGVAVAVGAGAEPQAGWSPETSRDEPAFLAYSITKTFTAALLLLLGEEGRLSLDDRLVRWFPNIAGADRISLRQLLNHTAGVPDYGGLRSYHEELRASPSKPWSFERFAARHSTKGCASSQEQLGRTQIPATCS